MALRKATITPATTSPFEDEDDVVAPAATDTREGTASAEVKDAEPVTQTDKGEKKMFDREIATTQSTEVAAPVNTAVAVANQGDFNKEVDAMYKGLDFEYGNFRVFKASNGSICETGEGEDLGRWVKVRMLAWDKHWEISPGSEKAAKDYLAFSDDGKTVHRVIGDEMQKFVGSSIDDYLKYLRQEEGFDRAGVREFVDVGCAVIGNENSVDLEGQVIQITLPPTSTTAFNKYQQSLVATARAVAMKVPGFKLPEDPFTFYFIAEKASKGDRKWTKLRIEQKLPNKL